MKHLKSYRIFESNQEIEKELEEYIIENYTIDLDGFVSVNDNVYLGKINLNEIPFKFKEITGYFDCNSNQLTTLKGCPESVGGDFYCFNNQLTTLEGCPQIVGGDFDCSNNKLTTLEGCPQYVGYEFECSHNKLTTLMYLPSDIPSDLSCQNNKLTSLDTSAWIQGNIYCEDNLFAEEPEFFGECDGKIFWK